MLSFLRVAGDLPGANKPGRQILPNVQLARRQNYSLVPGYTNVPGVSRMMRNRITVGIAAAGIGLLCRAKPSAKIWNFDRLDQIGGVSTQVLGHPRVVDSAVGKAIQFNGSDDALYINEHPLAGIRVFTWEAIFSPESGGAYEQRWFHLAEQNPISGADTDTRFLFEIRATEKEWSLDAFVHTPIANQPILNLEKRYPLDTWHAVAMVYDGKTFSSYVDSELQGSADIRFDPEGPGHTSVGVRINKVNFFKGSVHMARFTPIALSISEFLKVPDAARTVPAGPPK
jgi:hypothetical protein